MCCCSSNVRCFPSAPWAATLVAASAAVPELAAQRLAAERLVAKCLLLWHLPSPGWVARCPVAQDRLPLLKSFLVYPVDSEWVSTQT